MSSWRATASLTRALATATTGLLVAVAFGEPVLAVLVAPLAVLAALGLAHRPAGHPRLHTRLEHHTLYEGQGTRSHLVLEDGHATEHVVRAAAAAPYVALHPRRGAVGAFSPPVLEVSPRRWGRRDVGEERVALTGPWAGFRWGPVLVGGPTLWALPQRAPFDSRAEAPHPEGLVGRHRSARPGDGTELATIRPFQTGDRLRRVSWRVSLRADRLHVVTTRAEQDAGVLLVVDATADHGRSGGVGGAESTLDVGVRAAAALAEHHVRIGDRVALRVLGTGHEHVGHGAGRRHLRVLLGTLARVRPGEPGELSADRLRLPTEAGSVVLVLTPMLSELTAGVIGRLVARGLSVLVVDTLPDDLAPEVADGADPAVADLAWRMRRLEREELLARLAALGCPVVPWRGPGTLDEVLRRVARRAAAPRVVAR